MASILNSTVLAQSGAGSQSRDNNRFLNEKFHQREAAGDDAHAPSIAAAAGCARIGDPGERAAGERRAPPCLLRKSHSWLTPTTPPAPRAKSRRRWVSTRRSPTGGQDLSHRDASKLDHDGHGARVLSGLGPKDEDGVLQPCPVV